LFQEDANEQLKQKCAADMASSQPLLDQLKEIRIPSDEAERKVGRELSRALVGDLKKAVNALVDKEFGSSSSPQKKRYKDCLWDYITTFAPPALKGSIWILRGKEDRM